MALVFWLASIGVAAGLDCGCRDTQEPVWQWLREAAVQVKSSDRNLRGPNVHEVCRVTYPFLARSFVLNETSDSFVLLKNKIISSQH